MRRRQIAFGTSSCERAADAPAWVQSSADVECDESGERCSMAPGYFPEAVDSNFYLSLAALAPALLPPSALARPRVLLIGGGAGVLPHLLGSVLAAADIDSLEPNAAVRALSRRFFRSAGEQAGVRAVSASAPAVWSSRGARVSEHAQSAVDFLLGLPRRATYDVIVLDAYENDGSDSSMPRAFRARGFAATLERALAPHGLVVANLFDGDDGTTPLVEHLNARRRFSSRLVLRAARSQTVEIWVPAAASEGVRTREAFASVVAARLASAHPGAAAQPGPAALATLARGAWEGVLDCRPGRGAAGAARGASL